MARGLRPGGAAGRRSEGLTGRGVEERSTSFRERREDSEDALQDRLWKARRAILVDEYIHAPRTDDPLARPVTVSAVRCAACGRASGFGTPPHCAAGPP